MYIYINQYLLFISSPRHLKLRDISATTWHHRQSAAGTEVTKVTYEFVKSFEIWKFPSPPSEADLKQHQTCPSCLMKTTSDWDFLRLSEEEKQASSLLITAGKQMEIGVGRRNQMDEDPVKSRRRGGRLDALLAAVIQWSSRLHSGNKVQGQTSQALQRFPKASETPASAHPCCKPSGVQRGHGLVAPHPSMSFPLPACKRAPRSTEGRTGLCSPWQERNWEAERSQPRSRESQPSRAASGSSVPEKDTSHQPCGQLPSPWTLLSFPAQPRCQFLITTHQTESVRTGIRHHLTSAGLQHHHQLPGARASHCQLLHMSEHLVSQHHPNLFHCNSLTPRTPQPTPLLARSEAFACHVSFRASQRGCVFAIPSSARVSSPASAKLRAPRHHRLQQICLYP